MARIFGSAAWRNAALPLLPLVAACATVPASRPPAKAAAPAQTEPARPRTVPPTTPAPPPRQAFRPPQIQQLPGLEAVIEKNAPALIREFGTPRLDVRDGDVRKLQFAGEPCVLDIFLYPLKPGAEPVATYVDARRASDGLDVDRASCVAALMQH